MNSSRQIGFLLMVCVAIFGCRRGPNVGRGDLIGDYVISYSHGNELLSLFADETFLQQFTNSAARVMTNAGKWRLVGSDGSEFLLLEGRAEFETDGSGLAKCNCGLNLTGSRQALRLSLGSENEYVYRRRSPIRDSIVPRPTPEGAYAPLKSN